MLARERGWSIAAAAIATNSMAAVALGRGFQSPPIRLPPSSVRTAIMSARMRARAAVNSQGMSGVGASLS